MQISALYHFSTANPPIVTIVPLSVNTIRGQRVTFSCSANSVGQAGEGAGTFVYGWLLNGIPIDGEAKQTLTVTNSEDNAGNYQCTVRSVYNGFGRSPIATLTLS